MKYRRLNNEELENMKNEFIRFLVSNGIVADEWEQLKKENLTKAEGLIEIFSDIVFEKVLEKVAFAEFRTSHDFKTFKFLEDKILLIGVRVNPQIQIDFTQPQATENMLAAVRTMPQGSIQLYRAEKRYTDAPKKEIFKMLESGAFISDGHLFETLSKLSNNE
jgi:hypothetical protein